MGVRKFGFSDLATDGATMNILIEPRRTPRSLLVQFYVPPTVAQLWEDISDHGEFDDRREPLVARIDELAHSRRLKRIVRRELRSLEDRVDVLIDDGGLSDRLAVVHQGRHDAFRVDREVFRL